MIVCPYCFNEFKSSDVMFRCNNENGCKKTNDPQLSAFWGSTRMETPAFDAGFSLGKMLGKMPESAVCPDCKKKSYTVICPHCHNRIPKRMVEKKGFIISIIGARSSGKTNYITVLINELMKNGKCLGNLGITPSAVADKPENSTHQHYKRHFFDTLYNKGIVPAQTKIGDEISKIPLIYELRQPNRSYIYLVFYDTAGENFNDPRNILNNVKFLDNSDATIFLIDTFTVPKVHEKLKSKLGLGPIELEFDTILKNIMSHYNDDVDPSVQKQYYKKPMALVFSKIDAILNNEEEFEGSSIPGMNIESNSPYLTTRKVNLDDLDSVSAGMTSVLQAWNEDNFLNNIKNSYHNHKFFGISALGNSPKGDKVDNLRPYRVLDPLVWILHELGFSFPLDK